MQFDYIQSRTPNFFLEFLMKKTFYQSNLRLLILNMCVLLLFV